jgi:hypothetical protein
MKYAILNKRIEKPIGTVLSKSFSTRLLAEVGLSWRQNILPVMRIILLFFEYHNRNKCMVTVSIGVQPYTCA